MNATGRAALGDALRAAGIDVLADHPLGPLTTYRVGGRAAWYVEVVDPAELVALATVAAATNAPVLVVGNGSNLLIADSGFDGLAVRLGEAFADIVVEGEHVTAGGAASLPVVARRTVAAGLTGFEWAVGVPGTIGGAVRMNAGGHGSDLAAALTEVRVVDLRDGQDVRVPATDLHLGYRSSAVEAGHIVVDARLRLQRAIDPAAGERELSEIVRWRREHQPGGQNAGSVFTNPPGDSAGRLIDESGCKGLRVGTAEVSTKHANFIQADAGGSADDVRELMVEVRRRVAAATGVELHAETVLVGFDAAEVDAAGGSPR